MGEEMAMDEKYKDYASKSVLAFPKLSRLRQYLVDVPDGIIAGGCFKDIFTGSRIKDIDTFFKDEDHMTQAVATLAANKQYVPAYESPKVTAFKNSDTGITIELIKSVYGSALDILKGFDFTVAKFAYFQIGSEYWCVYHHDYFEHLTQRRLVVDDQMLFPVSTFERMLRYAGKGYHSCRDTKVKVVEAINALQEIPDISASLYDGVD
jgi:hypothetical protein